MALPSDPGVPVTAMAPEEPVPSRRTLVVIAVLALVVHGLLWWLYYHGGAKALWGDEHTYMTSASRLLAGDPAWQPDFLWPPLYSRFVAGIIGLGGSLVWLQLAQTLLLIAFAVVLCDLTRRLTGSRVAAVTASGLALSYPPLAAFAHYLWPEIVHLFLFVAALWVLVADRRGAGWSVLCGVALGLALLAKSLLTPFVPVLLVAEYLHRREPGFVISGRALRRVVLIAVAIAVTIAPTVREQRRRTGVAMIASSSTFNLWVGLNDRARKSFADEIVHPAYREYTTSSPVLTERNLILRRRIARFFREHPLAEVLWRQLGRQYFRLFDKDSYLTDQLPGGPAAAQGEGYVGVGRAPAALVRAISYAVYGLILVSAPVGLALLWRARDSLWLRVLLLFLVYNLALFFWFHVKSRYRIQFLPVLLVGSGGAVAWMRCWIRETPMPGLGRALWVLAASAAVVLLFLALAGPYL